MKKLFIALLLAVPIASCAQDEEKLVKQLDQQLSAGSKSVTQVLTDPSYMKLHSLTNFRHVVRKHAKQEKISLVTKTEPGIPTTIKCQLAGNLPVANLLIYVYQTDHKGWYVDTGAHVSAAAGDRGHARLFGYLRSDKDGKFEFNTIQPQGYPNTELPQHIHLEVFDGTGRSLTITELLFDDDSRLVGSTRASMLRSGYVVAKNEGPSHKLVYSYKVQL